MTSPAKVKIGQCVLTDIVGDKSNSPVVKYAVHHVETAAIKSVGCGTDSYDAETHQLREKACSLVKKTVKSVTSNPLFRNAVTYFAKWYAGEYSLRKDGKPVLGPHSPDRSPPAVIKAHQKCLKK